MKNITLIIVMLSCMSLFVACCPTKPYIEGCYNTTYFDKINDTIKPYQSNVPIQLSFVSSDSIIGTWTSNGDGKIYGKLDPSHRVLIGVWKTTNYQGKIRFVFDDASNFTGFWNGSTPRGNIDEWLSWDGTNVPCKK